MIEEKLLPKTYLKYSSFDKNGYYKKLLLENSLYFSSPKNFNDPFDCKVYPNYEVGTKKQIFNKFLEHADLSHPRLPLSERKKIAKKEFDKNFNIIKNPILFEKRVTDIINTGFGIFSLTEKCDNLLMWAHYSDNHTGFCIEFNAKRLFEICKNYIIIKELIMLYKVKYERHYPIINPYSSDYDIQTFVLWLITKSVEWEYEQEWRLIYTMHPNESLVFPDDVIEAIYFGVRSDPTIVNETIKLLSKKSIKPNYYQAILKRKEFGLLFKKISKI